MDTDVVCVGHCAWDLLSVVNTFPENDTKIEALDFIEQGGGPAATAAVTLARLGARAAIVGKIGDDVWGRRIHSGFTAEHVDTHALLVQKSSTSPLSLILVEQETGKRTIVHNRGTVRPLSEDDVNPGLLPASRFLLIDGLHPEGALVAAQLARDHGTCVVLDTGAFKPLAVDLLKVSDVIIAPEYFVAGFRPEASLPDVAGELLDIGAETVVLTQGERGGRCFSRAGDFRYPGFDVTVIDTTGAGDVFHGAFVCGLLKAWDLNKTATFASAVAALKCTKLGGRTGIPTMEEALVFLRVRNLWD
jgi:ribokinase